MTDVYRVWYGDENDRSEIGRLITDLEPDDERILSEYLIFTDDFNHDDLMIDGDENMIYIIWDVGPYNPSTGDEITTDEMERLIYDDDNGFMEEEFYHTEYLEFDKIENPTDDDEHFHTIMGTDEVKRIMMEV